MQFTRFQVPSVTVGSLYPRALALSVVGIELAAPPPRLVSTLLVHPVLLCALRRQHAPRPGPPSASAVPASAMAAVDGRRRALMAVVLVILVLVLLLLVVLVILVVLLLGLVMVLVPVLVVLRGMCAEPRLGVVPHGLADFHPAAAADPIPGTCLAVIVVKIRMIRVGVEGSLLEGVRLLDAHAPLGPSPPAD